MTGAVTNLLPGRACAGPTPTASTAPDTIMALSSGHGVAGIAVIRISGPASGPVLDRLVGRRPPPRRMSLRAIRNEGGLLLDRGVVVWLPGPGSYTGEDGAEFHVHGGTAVIASVLDALGACGLRLADPGEFTRRAFLAGRVDLLEAEGIADLAAAETEAQRRQAIAQADGGLSFVLEGWTTRLRALLARQEALIDFPDEADDGADARTAIAELEAELRNQLSNRTGERLRAGLTLAVTGPPNVGKSSLVNRLAAREVAIVSAIPGTTRDRLETRLVIGGVPLMLVDTAGIRETDDVVEAEGVRRARISAREADLVIDVTAAGERASELPSNPNCMRVFNKVDLEPAPPGTLGISILRGDGVDTLIAALEIIVQRLAGRGEQPVLTRARHRIAIEAAADALRAAGATPWPELRGEELRNAMDDLGRLTGRVGVEDLLDTIFSTFCVGK